MNKYPSDRLLKNPSDPTEALPTETFEHILNFLDFKTLMIAGTASKTWQERTQAIKKRGEELWKKVLTSPEKAEEILSNSELRETLSKHREIMELSSKNSSELYEIATHNPTTALMMLLTPELREKLALSSYRIGHIACSDKNVARFAIVIPELASKLGDGVIDYIFHTHREFKPTILQNLTLYSTLSAEYKMRLMSQDCQLQLNKFSLI